MPKAVSYAQGAIIFFSGDRDEHIYIVQSGLILNQEVDIETGQQITEKLKPGEFFGVKSTLARMPHMVTAYAATDSVVIVMTLQEFEKLFANKRDVTEKMLRVFSKTLREIHHKMQSILHNDAVAIPQDLGMMMVAKAFYDDDEFFSCASVLTRLLEKMPDAGNKEAAEKLLADAKVKAEQYAHGTQTAVSSVDSADDASLKQFSAPIFQRFTKEFKKGEVIVTEFEPGETFYLIKSGDVQIVKCITGQNKNLDILHKGEFFGEMAILDKSPRAATCVAHSDVSLLEFNKENFASLVLGNPHLVMNLLKLFCKRIYDQQRSIKIILIKDISVRICDVFLMYDEHIVSPESELMNQRRTFNITVNDIAHWAGISVAAAKEEMNKLAAKDKIQVFDGYVNIMNIRDMKRVVDSYYANLAVKS